MPTEFPLKRAFLEEYAESGEKRGHVCGDRAAGYILGPPKTVMQAPEAWQSLAENRPILDQLSDTSSISADQWVRVKEIFHAAVECPPDERAAFLRTACQGDSSVAAAVESLLANDDQARCFLESPAAARIGVPEVAEEPTLTIGQQLGAYQILTPLGAGGMGEVYRAIDVRLQREVALKVLPSAVTRDRDRRERFEREARAAAALDHPNICTVYDIGEHDGRLWIAMQFIEGETLGERLARGPLDPSTALDIAGQIAQALSAAHARGIVHRDIKPQNVMVAASGHVKVLDFGLAKLAGVAEIGRSISVGTAPSDRPRTVLSTIDGRILGTLPYMSPEQMRGEPIDARTDVFSLGAVLFELLTSRRPFIGRTDVDITAAILSSAPPGITQLVPDAPGALDPIVRKCLEKDRQGRYHTMRELATDLADVQARLQSTKQRVLPRVWVAAAVAGLVMAGSLAWWAPSVGQRRPVKPVAPLQYARLTNFPDSVHSPAISHDGKMLAFVRGGAETFQLDKGELYVKALVDGHPLALTNDGAMKMAPTFTLDASQIVYTSAGWSSWTVPATGGTPSLFRQNAASLRWMSPGEVLFSQIRQSPNMAIVAATERGVVRDVYVPASPAGMAHFSEPSPDRQWILVVEMDNRWLPCRVVPFDGSSEGHRVGPPASECTSAAWSPDGRWMYFAAAVDGESHLWRQHFPEGQPEQITFGPTEERGLAIDPNGRSVITSVGGTQSTVWYHDEKSERPISVEGYAYRPLLSSDGSRVFYLVRRAARRSFSIGELWVTDLATGRNQRLLPEFLVRSYDVSRDGKLVVFDGFDENDRSHLWMASTDGGQALRRLTSGGNVEAQRPFFGASGGVYFMRQTSPAKAFLYRMNPDGSGRQKLSDAIGFLVNISGDEKWAAVWNLDGPNGVWLVPLAGGAARWLCSCAMGPIFQDAPRVSWSGDGTTMFVNLGKPTGRAGGTVAIPWQNVKTFPTAAASSTTNLLDLPGARRIPEPSISPGLTADTYAFTRQAEQSNLYRIQLP